MARKRMLSEEILCSDAFLDMTQGARMLYVYLNQAADDDGFVSAPKRVSRECRCSEQDLMEILRCKFAYIFPSGVVVLKHWRINNSIRSDRYAPTTWRDEWNQILIKENGSYSLKDSDEDPQISMGGTNWLPSGIPCVDQDGTVGMLSIDKVSIDKVSIDKDDVTDGDQPPVQDSPKRGRKKKEPDIDPFVVFAGADAELLSALKDFEEMRNTIKKPLTLRAKTDLIGDLNRISVNRNDWIESLKTSIKNCWKGVFPPKKHDYPDARVREKNRREIEELEKRIEQEKDEKSKLVDSVKGIYSRGVPNFTPKGLDD